MTSPRSSEFLSAPVQFGKVAAIYDDLMAGISYDVWLRYLRQLWRRRGLSPRSVLDVACGTGNMSYLLAEAGCRVAGIDSAAAMIAEARAKSRNRTLPPEQQNPAFYCQDASAIHLDQSFDAAISLFDSLNYLLDYDRLKACFAAVSAHLNPGGLFIFDVNTQYALAHRFFDQDNLEIGNFPLYQWKSRWDEQTRICAIEMEFQALTDTGVDIFRETHLQRGYSIPELRAGLLEAGFQDIEFLQAFTFKPPRAKTDRLYVIAGLPGA